ncbi:MAG TPA: MFS transporter [Xanthobacteraceae bacterium]|nr:MFS transporter [Xanthobacteraceae bacterium]
MSTSMRRRVFSSGDAHGYDKRVLLDALARFLRRLRGVAITDTRITPRELPEWHRLGMRVLNPERLIWGIGWLSLPRLWMLSRAQVEAAVASDRDTTKHGLFYGWLVVAGAFTVTCVGFGCAYSFSAFVESLEREFGGSRGSVSLVFSLAGFLYFSLGSISGPLADRLGSRRLAVAGMLLIGGGVALAGLAQTLGQVYAAYGLGVGLGVGSSYVPAMGAVQRWFVRHRGLASGLASSGIGIGTLIAPPLAAALIASFGWRAAYLVLGGGSAVLGAGMALLIENDPRDRGLAPDGDPPHGSGKSVSASGASLREAIKSRRFIGLYGACLACSFAVFVPFVHLVPYAIDHGITQAVAVWLVSAIGVGSAAGRFLLGGAADRLGREFSLLAMFLGMALALAIWLVSTSFWPLVLFAFLFGTAYGGWVALLPAVVMDYFGGRNVSGIIGLLYTSVGFGTLIGPSAAGFAFDVMHSYTLPIAAGIGFNVIAAAVIAVTSRPAVGQTI